MKVGKIFAILLFIASILPLHAEDKRDTEKMVISDEELLEILNFFDLLENLDLFEEVEFFENFEILYFQEVLE